jgi:microcystin-dependent protein
MANTPILNLPYPTPDDTVDPPRDIGALANAIDPLGVVPVGCMMMWPTGVAPAGWLLANGQQVDAATYPGLSALFGQVGGKVTLPDYRDTFPVGAGPVTPLGQVGGAASVALATNQLPAHNHGVTDPGHAHGEAAAGYHSHGGTTAARDRSQAHGHTVHSNYSIYNASGGSQVNWSQNTNLQAMYRTNMVADAADPADHLHGISGDGSHTHAISSAATGIGTQNAGGGATHENRPPYRAINFIVRAG